MSHEVWTDLFGDQHNECICRLCEKSRKLTDIISRRNVDELIVAVDDLHNENYNIGADLEYLQCVMNGSWPSAVEQLERALEMAKNHPNRKIEDEERRPWLKKKVNTVQNAV